MTEATFGDGESSDRDPLEILNTRRRCWIQVYRLFRTIFGLPGLWWIGSTLDWFSRWANTPVGASIDGLIHCGLLGYMHWTAFRTKALLGIFWLKIFVVLMSILSLNLPRIEDFPRTGPEFALQWEEWGSISKVIGFLPPMVIPCSGSNQALVDRWLDPYLPFACVKGTDDAFAAALSCDPEGSRKTSPSEGETSESGPVASDFDSESGSVAWLESTGLFSYWSSTANQSLPTFLPPETEAREQTPVKSDMKRVDHRTERSSAFSSYPSIPYPSISHTSSSIVQAVRSAVRSTLTLHWRREA